MVVSNHKVAWWGWHTQARHEQYQTNIRKLRLFSCCTGNPLHSIIFTDDGANEQGGEKHDILFPVVLGRCCPTGFSN